MPTSHHRRKHKPHPQQPLADKHKRKGSAAWIVAIAGSMVGLAITYLASEASTGGIIAGMFIGALLGFYAGRNIDKAVKKHE